jgi:hypothetical protein
VRKTFAARAEEFFAHAVAVAEATPVSGAELNEEVSNASRLRSSVDMLFLFRTIESVSRPQSCDLQYTTLNLHMGFNSPRYSAKPRNPAVYRDPRYIRNRNSLVFWDPVLSWGEKTRSIATRGEQVRGKSRPHCTPVRRRKLRRLEP